MTRKIRENLLILLISNAITIILFVTAPYIFRAVANLKATENNNLMLFSLPTLLYLILLSLLVCIITVLYRLHADKRIIINNSITSLQPTTSEKDKAEIMRKIHKNKQDQLEINRYEAIKEYTYTVFSPYMTDDYLEILCQNIKLYEIPESCINSVLTNGQLNTLDIRHYAWNIGERLGWSGQTRATFIKLCFPKELHDVEVESIRRTLRQKGKCKIGIDIPDKDSYEFHY